MTSTHDLILKLVDAALGRSLVSQSGLHEGLTVTNSLSLARPSTATSGSSVADARLAAISAKRAYIGDYALSILSARMSSPLPADQAEALAWAAARVKSKGNCPARCIA